MVNHHECDLKLGELRFVLFGRLHYELVDVIIHIYIVLPSEIIVIRPTVSFPL